MAKRTSLFKELLQFIMARKAYWIAPVIIVLLLLAVLIILGSTAAAPFIYTLF